MGPRFVHQSFFRNWPQPTLPLCHAYRLWLWTRAATFLQTQGDATLFDTHVSCPSGSVPITLTSMTRALGYAPSLCVAQRVPRHTSTYPSRNRTLDEISPMALLCTHLCGALHGLQSPRGNNVGVVNVERGNMLPCLHTLFGHLTHQISTMQQLWDISEYDIMSHG